MSMNNRRNDNDENWGVPELQAWNDAPQADDACEKDDLFDIGGPFLEELTCDSDVLFGVDWGKYSSLELMYAALGNDPNTPKKPTSAVVDHILAELSHELSEGIARTTGAHSPRSTVRLHIESLEDHR